MTKTWENLRPASFRGVAFEVESHSESGGRRVELQPRLGLFARRALDLRAAFLQHALDPLPALFRARRRVHHPGVCSSDDPLRLQRRDRPLADGAPCRGEESPEIEGNGTHADWP